MVCYFYFVHDTAAFFVKGEKENESPKLEELPKQEQINSADNSNGYKEHPEVVLLPEDPGIDNLSISFINSQNFICQYIMRLVIIFNKHY